MLAAARTRVDFVNTDKRRHWAWVKDQAGRARNSDQSSKRAIHNNSPLKSAAPKINTKQPGPGAGIKNRPAAQIAAPALTLSILCPHPMRTRRLWLR